MTARSPSVLHVDMDCFYAAVEMHDNPSLSGRPVIVGGTGDRGVVAACSYEARVHGVHSAMPMTRARRLCPGAVVLPGRFGRYAEVSEHLHAIFHDVTPLVESISLDEAFLDVSGAHRLLGDSREVAESIRHRVHVETGLAASVGIAGCKFLAKLASRAAKPQIDRPAGTLVPGAGIVTIGEGEELDFLHPLAVSALWGVGPSTQRRLTSMGVETVGDLSRVPLASLQSALGNAVAQHLHELSRGIDPRPVCPDVPAKSIGHEETFAQDIRGRAELDRELLRLADGVAQRMREAGWGGARTVTIKLRHGDFTTITRSETPAEAATSATDVAEIALRLARSTEIGPGFRLAGVSVSNPLDLHEGVQLAFSLAGDRLRSDAVWSSIGAIRERFGEQSVGPASLTGEKGLRVKRRGDTQWGPSTPD